MFANNQTLLDMRGVNVSLGVSSQMITTLSDLDYNNNQSECASILIPKVTADVVACDVFLLGFSIRSNSNRFTEGFTQTKTSLFSYGLMNTAIGNQASRCLLVYAKSTLRIEHSNLVLGNATVDNDPCQDLYFQIAASLGLTKGSSE
jgi:hypothetical protein